MQDKIFLKIRTLRKPTHLMSVIFWEQGFSDGVILYNAQLWFFVFFFLSFPNHKAASRQPQLHVSFSCVYPPTNSETGFRRVQCLLPPVSTSTVATNTWVGSPHLYVPACSFRSRKTTKYIAIITKEQQQNFFFWRWCLYSFSHFFHKSHLLEESVVFPDITIQLF